MSSGPWLSRSKSQVVLSCKGPRVKWSLAVKVHKSSGPWLSKSKSQVVLNCPSPKAKLSLAVEDPVSSGPLLSRSTSGPQGQIGRRPREHSTPDDRGPSGPLTGPISLSVWQGCFYDYRKLQMFSLLASGRYKLDIFSEQIRDILAE